MDAPAAIGIAGIACVLACVMISVGIGSNLEGAIRLIAVSVVICEGVAGICHGSIGLQLTPVHFEFLLLTFLCSLRFAANTPPLSLKTASRPNCHFYWTIIYIMHKAEWPTLLLQ
jgi:hypothetical protein